MHTSIRRGRCRNNFRDSGGDKADSNCSETSTRDRPNQEDPSLIQWKNPIVLSNSQQGSDEFRSRDVYGYGLILPSPSQASVHSLQESVPSFPSFPLFPSFPTLLSISVSSHCLPISLCPSISQASEAQQPGTMATGGAGPTMEADELDLDTMMIGMADEEMGECEGMGMGMGGMAGFEDEDASEYSGYSGQFPGGAEGGYRGVHGYEGMENWRWGGAVDGVGHAMTSTSRPTEGAGPRRATTVVRLQDGRKRRTSLLDSSEADDDALERLESDFLNLDNDDLDPLMFDDADLDFDFAAFAHSLSLGTTAYLPSAPVLQSAPSSAAPSSATAIARNQLHSFRAPFTLPDITEDGPALDSSSRMERDPRYANHHLPFSILHASSSLANSHANSTTTTALFDLAVSTAKNANHMTVAPSSIYTQHHHLLSQTPQSRSTAPIATSAAPRRQTASSSTPLKTIDIKPKRKSSNLHRKSSASTLKEPDFFTSLGFVNMDTTPAPVSSLMPVSVEITNEYEGVESPDTPNPAFPDSMVQVGTDVDADYETVLMTDAGVEDNDFFSNASIEEILKATRDAALAVSGAVVGSSAFVGSSSYMGASMVAASADASGTNVHGMAFDFDMDQATLPLFHSASLSASTGGGTSGMGSLFGGMSLGGVLFPSFSEVQEGISQVGHPLEGAELDSEGPCFAGSVAMEDDCPVKHELVEPTLTTSAENEMQMKPRPKGRPRKHPRVPKKEVSKADKETAMTSNPSSLPVTKASRKRATFSRDQSGSPKPGVRQDLEATPKRILVPENEKNSNTRRTVKETILCCTCGGAVGVLELRATPRVLNAPRVTELQCCDCATLAGVGTSSIDDAIMQAVAEAAAAVAPMAPKASTVTAVGGGKSGGRKKKGATLYPPALPISLVKEEASVLAQQLQTIVHPCLACKRTTAHGTVTLAPLPTDPHPPQQTDLTVAVTCTHCDAAYQFCAECGGGGKTRTGKFRPRALFPGNRRTCALPHIRQGTAPLHTRVLPTGAVSRKMLEGMRDVLFDCLVGLYAVPGCLEDGGGGEEDEAGAGLGFGGKGLRDVFAHVEEGWRRLVADVIARGVRGGVGLGGKKVFVTVAWIEKDYRMKAKGLSGGVASSVAPCKSESNNSGMWFSKIGMDTSLQATKDALSCLVLTEEDAGAAENRTFVSFAVSEWDQEKGTLFISEIKPRSLNQATVEWNRELLRQTLEHVLCEAAALPNVPPLEHVWCCTSPSFHMRVRNLPQRVGYVALAQYEDAVDKDAFAVAPDSMAQDVWVLNVKKFLEMGKGK